MIRKIFGFDGIKIVASTAATFASAISCAFADASDATAAANGSSCQAAQPFYWEIGRANGTIDVSGQVGGSNYNRNTVVKLASASKWVFSAYAFERYGTVPSSGMMSTALRMLRGHTSFSPALCAWTSTVGACRTIRDNDKVDQSAVGSFNYNGGDGQEFAALELGLAWKRKYWLLNEVDSYLNLGSSFSYVTTGVAGGMKASAADYAQFLRKIMNGAYTISNYLGAGAVNTQCPSCDSPFGTADLHYSYYHWVEDNTGGALPNGTSLTAGDGAYSSPGAKGFYPWINASRTRYGIVSTDSSNFQDSYVCGKAIREAYFQ